MVLAARRHRTGDLAGGVGVKVRSIARVVCRRVLADHERPVAGHRQKGLAQDLIRDEVPGRRGVRLTQRLVHRRQGGIDDFAVQLDQIGHLFAGPHLPVLARTPRAGRQFDGRADEAFSNGVRQCADPHPCLGKGAQHAFQPHRAFVPPMPEQFGVEGRDHVCGPADAFALADEALANQRDEIGDVAVDRVVGAFRVVGRFGVRGDIAPGNPCRLEARGVVVGVEVAVRGVAGIARLR